MTMILDYFSHTIIYHLIILILIYFIFIDDIYLKPTI